MSERSNSNDRMRAVLVLIATMGTIAFNWLAATGGVNGITPESISDKYPTLITPARYAFSIWSLIYLSLAAFSIYQFGRTVSPTVGRIRSLYILTCVFNCGWIYAWHYDQIGTSLVVIILLLCTLLLIEVNVRELRSTRETWLLRAPFGLYLGWVSVAAMVNFYVYLVYLGVDISAAAAIALASILILAAAAAAVLVRIALRNFFYPLAVAWALTAIAIGHSGNTAIVVSAAIGVVVCLVTTGSFVTGLRDSTSE